MAVLAQYSTAVNGSKNGTIAVNYPGHTMAPFYDFVHNFIGIFQAKQFRGSDFLAYLELPAAKRGGDEASVVDNTIISSILGFLGYSAGEQMYNQGKKFGRPDFTPETPRFGACFVVENKSTTLGLNLDFADPESHLSQLAGYLRSLGLFSGWLTNGSRIMIWRMDDPANPTCTCDLDIPTILREWNQNAADPLGQSSIKKLRYIWDQYSKTTFEDWQRLESSLGMELGVWEAQALPVGGHEANQELLVGSVKSLLQDLQADARTRLDGHLVRYAEFENRIQRLHDEDELFAATQLKKLRDQIEREVATRAPIIGLAQESVDDLMDRLYRLENDPFVFLNTRKMMDSTLDMLNAAYGLQRVDDGKKAKTWSKFDNGLGALGEYLKSYGDMAFVWHKRRAFLRHDFKVLRILPALVDGKFIRDGRRFNLVRVKSLRSDAFFVIKDGHAMTIFNMSTRA